MTTPEINLLREAAQAVVDHPFDVSFDITSGDPAIAYRWYMTVSPRRVLALIAIADASEKQIEAYEHDRTCDEDGEGDCCLEAHHQAYLALTEARKSLTGGSDA